MGELSLVDPKQAEPEVKTALDEVKAAFGRVPNVIRALANSPVALETYLAMAGAAEKGSLKPALRERIAVLVAQLNGCEYCLSAHSAAGKMVGLSPEELAAARRARAHDPRNEAALKFVRRVVVEGAHVDAEEVRGLKSAGFGDEEVSELMANVALHMFTNYFNLATHTDLDYPRVSLEMEQIEDVNDSVRAGS